MFKDKDNDLPGLTEWMDNNVFVNDLVHTGKYTKEMHPMYGIKHLKSSKKLMSEAASKKVGSLNGFYGKKHNDSKKDVEEPVHPIGWKDDVPETKTIMEKKDEEECETCVI